MPTRHAHSLVVAASVACTLSIAVRADEVRPEEDQTTMSEVVVTATKTEKELSDAPASVSVVTAKDIAKMNVQSPDEALTFLPGVYTDRPGGHQPSVMSTNVMLRGIPDFSRTLVLVDGQALNDPFIGAVTWESVPPETIDRIEVVPGPFSSLYGGSAMAGVINIITKVPSKRETIAKAGYGTGGLATGTAVYQDRPSEILGVIVDVAYAKSGGFVTDDVTTTTKTGTTGTPVSGWRPSTDPFGNPRYIIGDKGNSPWESWNAGAKFYLAMPGDGKISFGASHFDYKKEWDHFNTYLRDASGNPVSSGNITFNDNGDKTASITESQFLAGPNPKQQNRYTVTYDTKLGGTASLKASIGYLDTPIYDFTTPKPGATFDGGGPGTRLHRPNSETSSTLQLSGPAGERQFLVAGVDANHREIKTFQYLISDWRDADATGPVQNQTGGQDHTYAAFIQDEIALRNNVTAYVGGRYDWWSTNGFIEQIQAPASESDFSTRSQSYFSPKASLVFRPGTETTLRASTGKAFRPPMLRDTFGWWTPPAGLTFVPNPDLKPETVTSWEVGGEQQFGRTSLRATYYENSLKDLINRTQTATTQTVSNAARGMVKGVEVEVRQRLMTGLQAFVNATYNDAKITQNPMNPLTEGKRMTLTPQKMGNIGLLAKLGPWSGSIAGHYVGKVYANDQNLDVVNGVYGSYDPRFVMDTKVSYEATKTISLSLSINNLLDHAYYDATRAQGRAFYGEVAARF